MWQQWRAPVVKWYRPIFERSRLRVQVITMAHNAASFVHTVGTDRGRTQLNLLLTSLFFSFLFQTKSCDFPFSILSFYSGSLSLSLLSFICDFLLFIDIFPCRDWLNVWIRDVIESAGVPWSAANEIPPYLDQFRPGILNRQSVNRSKNSNKRWTSPPSQVSLT